MNEVAKFLAEKGDDTLRLNYNLDKDSIVIDAGGYKGWFAENIYNKYKCNVYVFEPVKEYYDLIVNKFKGKIYLTKDARMSKYSYEKQYTNKIPFTTKYFSHQMTRLENNNEHNFLIIGANSDIAKTTAIKYLSKYKNGHLILASRNINDLNKFNYFKTIDGSTSFSFLV